jgi:hypothetical protein
MSWHERKLRKPPPVVLVVPAVVVAVLATTAFLVKAPAAPGAFRSEAAFAAAAPARVAHPDAGVPLAEVARAKDATLAAAQARARAAAEQRADRRAAERRADRRQARRAARAAAAAAAQAAAQAAAAQQQAAAPPAPAPAPPAPPPPPGGGVLSPAQIGALWLSAGGSSSAEQTAICIAEAESGGNTQAVSPTDDFGVWQIHADPAALNPMVSAQAAVSMSGNGANWGAWTTAGSCGV